MRRSFLASSGSEAMPGRCGSTADYALMKRANRADNGRYDSQIANAHTEMNE